MYTCNRGGKKLNFISRRIFRQMRNVHYGKGYAAGKKSDRRKYIRLKFGKVYVPPVCVHPV